MFQRLIIRLSDAALIAAVCVRQYFKPLRRFLLGKLLMLSQHTELDAEMEKIRYEVGEATCFPASSLGAPHERQRTFQIYTRDTLSDPSCVGRYLEGLPSYDFFAPYRKNFWHGKRLSEPGLPRVAYGNFSNAEKDNIAKRLQIAGNGIVYDQAFFIGRFIKYFNEFFYDNEENKKCLKINL